MKKIVFTSIALATLAASPAFAATHKRVSHQDANVAANSYAGENYAAPDRYTVVDNDGHIVGRDPDAFIRLQLLRDSHVGDE